MRRWLKRGLGRRMSGPQHRLSGSGGSSGYQLGVNGCISHRREWVRRRAPIFAPKVLVGNISNGFGEGTEVWGAGYPSHGQYQGESDKGFFIWKVREYHAQRGYGGCRKELAIETIGDVHFDHEDGTKAAICMANFEKQAFKGTAKLHGFERGKRDRVLVDVIKRVVHDDARSAISLGDNT